MLTIALRAVCPASCIMRSRIFESFEAGRSYIIEDGSSVSRRKVDSIIVQSDQIFSDLCQYRVKYDETYRLVKKKDNRMYRMLHTHTHLLYRARRRVLSSSPNEIERELP